MRQIGFAAIAVAIVLLLTTLFARVTAPEIEAEVALQSAQAVREAGVGHVNVSVNGQRVTLTGRVSGGAGERAARTAVSDVWGSSAVLSELERMPRGVFEMTGYRFPGYLGLSGRLPGNDAELAIRSKLAYVGADDLKLGLDLHDRGDTERSGDWVANTSALLADALLLVERGSFALTDESITFDAVVRSEVAAARVERLLEQGELPGRVEVTIGLVGPLVEPDVEPKAEAGVFEV